MLLFVSIVWLWSMCIQNRIPCSLKIALSKLSSWHCVCVCLTVCESCQCLTHSHTQSTSSCRWFCNQNKQTCGGWRTALRAWSAEPLSCRICRTWQEQVGGNSGFGHEYSARLTPVRRTRSDMSDGKRKTYKESWSNYKTILYWILERLFAAIVLSQDKFV